MVVGQEVSAGCARVPVRFERGPEPRHEDPQRVLLPEGLLAPQVLQEPVGRDDRRGGEGEDRQQRTLLVGTDAQVTATETDLERSEQADVHPCAPRATRGSPPLTGRDRV